MINVSYLLMKCRISQTLRKHYGIFAEGSYDVYCTGSNANMLSGELTTYLSGRYIEFKVYSLTYNEFYSSTNWKIVLTLLRSSTNLEDYPI